ncbi:hypothetical protein IE077_001034 [Cardiosporidium cionae]|uniref:Cilia- and flagella-associated protein 58 central coiled coil domain-containing protein n=1 Tax=Cardiosporidium cionae TaxID=476202 RepID=A0ABQ7J660_9APIC|nr:hypothetical protein IE077_001034 [Cardiosporidium cionae]|eukprot:KAF8819438.1 hypothetical protein IE077_001034 [Cardiosporidium cionae]
MQNPNLERDNAAAANHLTDADGEGGAAPAIDEGMATPAIDAGMATPAIDAGMATTTVDEGEALPLQSCSLLPEVESNVTVLEEIESNGTFLHEIEIHNVNALGEAVDDDGNSDSTLDTNATALEVLEKELLEDLKSMEGDENLSKLQDEFKMLLRLLKASNSTVKNLKQKCEELKAEVDYNNERAQAMTRSTMRDQQEIATLKQEIAKYLNVVEEASEKEKGSMKTIEELKIEIQQLTHVAHIYSTTDDFNEEKIIALNEERDKLRKDQDELLETIEELNNNNEELERKIEEMEKIRQQDQENIQTLKELIHRNRVHIEKEKHRKGVLDEEVKQIKQNIETQQQQSKEKEMRIQKENETINALSMELEKKKNQDQFFMLRRELTRQCNELEIRLNEEIVKTGKLRSENRAKRQKMENKLAEIAFLKWQKATAEKLCERLRIKLLAAEEEKIHWNSKVKALKSEVELLNSDIERQEKKANIDKQAMESLFSQSRALNKNIMDFGSTAEMHSGILKQRDIEVIHLQKEITEHKKETAETLKRIEELQRHKEKLSSELSKAKNKYAGTLEELRSHEVGTKDLQGDIAQLKTRIAQQKGLYAVVRAERNNYSNEIMRKQGEITDLKRFANLCQYICIEHNNIPLCIACCTFYTRLMPFCLY